MAHFFLPADATASATASMGSSPSTSDMLVQLKFNFLHKMSKSSNIASARVKKDGLSQKNSAKEKNHTLNVKEKAVMTRARSMICLRLRIQPVKSD